MDNNWIVENLTNAFDVWNSKMTEMWSLLTESPQTFKGGTIWQTMEAINGGMQAMGYGLLVLFFAIGIFRSASGFRDFQRPEHLLRHFIYFVLAKLGITYGMDLLVDVFDVCNGIVATAAGSVGGLTGASVALPQEIADAIGDVGFLASIPLWLVTLLGSLLITVLAFHYDPHRLRALFQDLHVRRTVSGGAGVLCRGRDFSLRQGVPAELCGRVHGGCGDRTGLHYFFGLFLQRDVNGR